MMKINNEFKDKGFNFKGTMHEGIFVDSKEKVLVVVKTNGWHDYDVDTDVFLINLGFLSDGAMAVVDMMIEKEFINLTMNKDEILKEIEKKTNVEGTSDDI